MCLIKCVIHQTWRLIFCQQSAPSPLMIILEPSRERNQAARGRTTFDLLRSCSISDCFQYGNGMKLYFPEPIFTAPSFVVFALNFRLFSVKLLMFLAGK